MKHQRAGAGEQNALLVDQLLCFQVPESTDEPVVGIVVRASHVAVGQDIDVLVHRLMKLFVVAEHRTELPLLV